MRRLIICFFILSVVFSLVGCKARESFGEKLTEKIFDEAFDGKVDIDGDKVTIKGDNDEEVTFGDYKWPSSELAKIIPEFKDGKVNTVMESSEIVTITLDSVKEDDAASYIEDRKADFTQDPYEIMGEDYISFNGKNDSGITGSFTYMSGILVISLEKPAE